MNALEAQYNHDELHSKSLAKVLELEDCSMYNNTVLVDCMISVMASEFFNNKLAEESIRHFMYDDGFGKENSSRSITVDDLWENLCSSFVHIQSISKTDQNKINSSEAVFLNIDRLVKMHQDTADSRGAYNELSNIVLALKLNIDMLKKVSASNKEFFLVDTEHKIKFEKHIPNFHYESSTNQKESIKP
jgi:hypothetical protein